jgi:hypothetical protein
MAAATSMAKRQHIIEQFIAGKPMLQISKEEGLAYLTVWEVCRRYKEQGVAGLKPRYDNCGGKVHGSDELVWRAVRCLKHWHPGWGAGRIRAKLRQKYPHLALPCLRTLQRWMVANGQNKPRSHPPKEPRHWAREVHEVRQVDAKEEIVLANGEKVCWLNIEDEKSGAIIDPVVFPLQENL